MVWGVGLVPMFMVSAAVGVIGIIRWGSNLSNPDQLYPVVIGTMLPIGLKGIVLAGLLAAFMSTFSSTVNAGASYMTNDLYQKYIWRGATQAHYVWASKVCSILVVILGILIGMQALYLISTYACTHQWQAFWIASGVVIVSAVVLYFIWYRQLPKNSENISF